MLNKKGIEEEGSHFSTDNLVKIILFILVLAIALLIVIPRLSPEKEGGTILNFGKYILEILGAGE